jgi:N-acetyl-gamma-glutamyl-phosphate reductase
VDVVRALIASGVKVVDISADFRLKNPDLYQEWYGFSHTAPELLAETVYGLPEIYRKDISRARLVANPGCYPTSAILALAPVMKAGLIGTHVIIDSKSGVSGSGRTLNISSHYAEANEDVSAYALEGHRHLPEIEQEVARFMHGAKPVVTFVPHLVPMTRGILSTIYAPLSGRLEASKDGIAELKVLFQDFYKDEPFVRVSPVPPHSKHTTGSNMCVIYPTIDIRSGRVIIISTIDNLVKGAAGQAVQNMNIMLGMPEKAGLEAAALYP